MFVAQFSLSYLELNICYLQIGTSTSFSTPRKKRPRCSRKSTLPPQEEEEVRRIVNNYYLVETKRPTIKGMFLSKIRRM
jgi:hypothetical protein